jgi:hypothetical protein
MLTTRDALQQHLDCMDDEEAALWLAAMDGLTAGDSSGRLFAEACRQLAEWHARQATCTDG